MTIIRSRRVRVVLTDGTDYWFDQVSFPDKRSAEEYYANACYGFRKGVKVADYVELDFEYDTDGGSHGKKE